MVSVSLQTAYAQAIYSAELLLESLAKTNHTLKYSSLRIGTLVGGKGCLNENDCLTSIAKSALDGEPIHVAGSKQQQVAPCDTRDLVDALIVMLKTRPVRWKPVYDLCSDKRYELQDILTKTIETASKYNGGGQSKVYFENKEIARPYSRDTATFCKEMKWKPKFRSCLSPTPT